MQFLISIGHKRNEQQRRYCVPYLILFVVDSVSPGWVLVAVAMMAIGILLGSKALYEELKSRREGLVALRKQLGLVAGRQPLWRFPGGGKVRACHNCGKKLKLELLRSDGGKRRTIFGCEICR
jgi:hypothetical protein